MSKVKVHPFCPHAPKQKTRKLIVIEKKEEKFSSYTAIVLKLKRWSKKFSLNKIELKPK